MTLRVMAAEQAGHPHPVKVLSMAPGVVDTDMKALICDQQEENFPAVQRFHDLKENDQLWSAEFVARHTADLLNSPDFGQKLK